MWTSTCARQRRQFAFIKGIIDWNHKRYGINVITPNNMGITTGVHSGIMPALARLRAAGQQGADGDADL